MCFPTIDVINSETSQADFYRLQSVMTRLQKQAQTSIEEIKELEDCVKVVFPEKQGFFAFFVVFAGSPMLNTFLTSGTIGLIG